MKLALYSFVGSALVLVGLIRLRGCGSHDFNLLKNLCGFSFPSHFRCGVPLVFVVSQFWRALAFPYLGANGMSPPHPRPCCWPGW